MNDYIIKKIFKSKPPTRKIVGYWSALTGAICNIILFLTKLIVGITVNSISITADSFNNLSDLGTNLISFIGFKYADKPADRKHPFGHGRFEYLSAMIISIIIIIFSYELIKSSIHRIILPQPILFKSYVVPILFLSIIIKLWMVLFNKKLTQLIESQNLKAVILDSVADIFATSVVILSFFLADYTTFPLDGFAGIVVAVFIGYNGIEIFRDTMNSLIGARPSSELMQEIEAYILGFEGIQDVHDLMIHDYGPETKIASIHVEMSSAFSFLETHTIIDRIENAVNDIYGIDLLIHVDPIENECIDTQMAKEKIDAIIEPFASILSIHDFRIIHESGQKRISFDMIVDNQLSEAKIEQLKTSVIKQFKSYYPNFDLIINIEKKDVFIHG
jgi:cation diffusion facilitator family transporter